MADNVAITAGSGTNIAADDISSVFYQRVKVTWGADGTANDANATTPLPIQDTPATSGGVTTSSTVSAASTNATSVKGSAGHVYDITCTNANSSARYLKLYNKATSPTVGTDTPAWRIMIPGGGGVTAHYPKGLVFGTGIAFALTTGAADADTGSVAASDILVNIGYK